MKKEGKAEWDPQKLSSALTLLSPWKQDLGVSVEIKFIVFLMPVWRLAATGKAWF